MIGVLIGIAAYVLLVALIMRGISNLCPDAAADAEPDWLWDQPTDSLSDAAVDARFAEIKSHFRVLS